MAAAWQQFTDADGNDKARLEALAAALEDRTQSPPAHEMLRDLLMCPVNDDAFAKPERAREAIWTAIATITNGSDDHVKALQAEILQKMMAERFSRTETLRVMAQVLCRIVEWTYSVNKDKAAMDQTVDVADLLKQMYVTLTRPDERDATVQAMLQLMKDKENAKVVVRAGWCRAVLQVAIDAKKHSLVQEDANCDDSEDDDDEEEMPLNNSDVAQIHAVQVLHHLTQLVCFAHDNMAVAPGSPPEPVVCAVIVELMLSGVSLVVIESVRMLQMLLEHEFFAVHLSAVPDLRGALEKVLAWAQQGKLAADPYVETLAKQQFEQLVPLIDQYERKHGSLVGLSSAVMKWNDPAAALEAAARSKVDGNLYFRRGNFASSRDFYRRAIAVLRSAQAHQEQMQTHLTAKQVLERCSAGASVLVRCGDRWRAAMVADVDEDVGKVEVLYDATDEQAEEELVDVARIRLGMNTHMLAKFKELEVDCSMNMGKAYAQLWQHDKAAECFRHVIEKLEPTHVPALYQRGITHLALHDLKGAQQDLWQANHRCRRQKPVNQKLLTQISAAYKRLQTAHANKKKLDKKVVKQMMQYLATIPGLEET
ncbi:TPA: hypothetical protein N0F65_007676 [Lagenidium giganteum]|uniref:Uncharacterized protein n=1 Tax=Lagenidium giganteum TaxID=4803 RepID=A0AAV2Z7I7_9STRA|nr:TPA: hypothetical protein N0F65_007676 [Lagenidium giganteum]